jgi:hypothetical protein
MMKVDKLLKLLGKDWSMQIVEGEIRIANPTLGVAYKLKEFIDLIKKVKKPEDLPPVLAKVIYGKTFEELKSEVARYEQRERLGKAFLITAGGIGIVGLIYLLKKIFGG